MDALREAAIFIHGAGLKGRSTQNMSHVHATCCVNLGTQKHDEFGLQCKEAKSASPIDFEKQVETCLSFCVPIQV